MKKIIVFYSLISYINGMEQMPLIPFETDLHNAIKNGSSNHVEELLAPYLDNYERPHLYSLRPLLHQPSSTNFESHYNHAKTLTQKKREELRNCCNWHFMKHMALAAVLTGATALNGYYYFLNQEPTDSDTKTDKLLQLFSVATGAGISLKHAWHSLNNTDAQLAYEKQKQIQLLLKHACDKQGRSV